MRKTNLPSKHCNYGSIDKNTEESKMLADNLICARISKLDKKCWTYQIKKLLQLDQLLNLLQICNKILSKVNLKFLMIITMRLFLFQRKENQNVLTICLSNFDSIRKKLNQFGKYLKQISNIKYFERIVIHMVQD